MKFLASELLYSKDEGEQLMLKHKLFALREKGMEVEDIKESGVGFILKVMRTWHFHDKNLKESIQKMFNSYHNECLRLGISQNEPISGLTAQNEV